jgi:hypothetical protein
MSKNYGTAMYLIYREFESGSLLIDCAETEEDAKQKKQMYEKYFKSSKDQTSIVYTLNGSHWFYD